MLTTSIYSGKWFFMKQTYKSMLCCHFLHNLHGQLIMIGCNICCRIDRSKLMLCWSHFVMFCFCQNAQFPQFFIQLFHISGNSWLDYTKVVIVHLLSFWWLCSKKGTSCKSKIFSLFVHFLCDEEIFLFWSYRSTDTFYIVISKQVKNTHCLLIQGFHRTKQRCFFIQRLSAIRTKSSWNT